jgi:hypothetical protein
MLHLCFVPIFVLSPCLCIKFEEPFVNHVDQVNPYHRSTMDSYEASWFDTEKILKKMSSSRMITICSFITHKVAFLTSHLTITQAIP